MAFRGAFVLFMVLAQGAGLGSAPARAQTDAASELDPLVLASQEVDSGLALAREQADSGDLTAAMATVERVLLAHPQADEARLVHVSLLCRVDDREGARSELDQLAGHPISDQSWVNVTAACGAVPRPAPPPAGDGTESGQ